VNRADRHRPTEPGARDRNWRPAPPAWEHGEEPRQRGRGRAGDLGADGGV